MKKLMPRIFLFVLLTVYIISPYISYGDGDADKIQFTAEELEYIENAESIKMVVNPEWYPYEEIDSTGKHRGIGADLLALVAERTGLNFELIPTTNWTESLNASKNGNVDVISLLNETPERSEWLIFTEPYFIDQTIIITREEHDYIADLSQVTNKTIVLPRNSNLEEIIKKQYLNLKVITVETETEALEYVTHKKADLTLRSLTMGAYVIKTQGYFNLKIAGQIPEHNFYLRVGVNKNNPVLRDILNKGIASLTPEELQTAVNAHIALKIEPPINYGFLFLIFTVFLFILLIALLWNRQLRSLNHQLAKRQEELTELSTELAENEERYKALAQELERNNQLLNEKITIDKLTGIKNRFYFDHKINEEIDRSQRYETPLSLLFFDLDKFKDVNDNFGHDVGDQVLIRIASTVQEHMRKTDVFARWGGEEFAVLLTDTTLESGKVVAEKIRQIISEIVHPLVGQVTVSIGLTEHLKNETLDSWFKRTDHAMYGAKSGGRNQVCVSESNDVGIHMAIQWHPNWECGNPIIDGQHKQLLELGNALIESSFNDKSMEHLMTLFDQLMNHLVVHFKDEEALLHEVHFEEEENHIKLHQALIDKASRLKHILAGDDSKSSQAVEFIVNTIITNHLLKEDIKYFHHFSKNTPV